MIVYLSVQTVFVIGCLLKSFGTNQWVSSDLQACNIAVVFPEAVKISEQFVVVFGLGNCASQGTQ
jgi:hypothetical protein